MDHLTKKRDLYDDVLMNLTKVKDINQAIEVRDTLEDALAFIQDAPPDEETKTPYLAYMGFPASAR